MIFLRLSILLLFLSINCTAQSNFDFAKKQVEVWKLAKQRTIAVAKAMPEEQYSYQPTPDVKSFGQQMTHLTNSMLSINNRFILKKGHSGREKSASGMRKSQIITELGQAFDQVITTFQTMSDADLQAEGKSHGAFPLTKWQSLLFMQDHITNHRAKAVLYLRLKGIRPPSYGYN